MWNRHDYLMLAGAAVATFGITLTAFWPRHVSAIDPVNVMANVATPTLQLNGINVHAVVPASRNELWSEAIPVTAGNLPTMSLIVENTTDAPATAEFTASLNLASKPVRMSRSLMVPNNGWSSNYVVNLAPHEKQTLLVTGTQTINLNAGERASLVLSRTAGPQVVLGTGNNANYVVAVTLVGAVELPGTFDMRQALANPLPAPPPFATITRWGATPLPAPGPTFSGRANLNDLLFVTKPATNQGVEIIRPDKTIPMFQAPTTLYNVPNFASALSRQTVYINPQQAPRTVVQPVVPSVYTWGLQATSPAPVATSTIEFSTNALAMDATITVRSNPAQGVQNITPSGTNPSLPSPNDLQPGPAAFPLNPASGVVTNLSGTAWYMQTSN